MSQYASDTATAAELLTGHDPVHYLRMFPGYVEEAPIGSLISEEQRAELIEWRKTKHINSEEEYQEALRVARTPFGQR